MYKFRKNKGSNSSRKRTRTTSNTTHIKSVKCNQQVQREHGHVKRKKYNKPSPEVNIEPNENDSSKSDEELINPVKQLLDTFHSNVLRKYVSPAIESEEDEDEEATEVEDEDEPSENKLEYESAENISKGEESDSSAETPLPTEETDDPFVKHFAYDLSDGLLDSLQQSHRSESHQLHWPVLGHLMLTIPKCSDETKAPSESSTFLLSDKKTYAPSGRIPRRIKPERVDLNTLHVKTQIHGHLRNANKDLDGTVDSCLTEFQCELFALVNNYQDVYFTERTFENADEIRFVYALHAINHVLKTRTKILHHNARLAQRDEVPEEFRDQGLVRPKVLILVPFRYSALKIVEMLIEILVPDDKGQVINKKRFVDDFTGGELIMPKKNPKPEDYELTFTGNCDDTFKIGIQITKKSLKLYADFYSSDIIIASPLGLRLVVGAEGESERDFDFLASIEVLVLDQADLFLMQNWDHVLQVLDHLHMQPSEAHGTNFTRVHTWALNGWAKYYRQTLLIGAHALPELSAVVNKKCANYAGVARTMNSIESGTIVNVHVALPQMYRRFDAVSPLQAIEARFQFFVQHVLPQYRDTVMKHCLIYVPNYFDYVRIRNHFKREDISFVQACEYSKDGKVARARDMFFHGDAHFLLYSERYHYFRRIRIKGIRHIIFYQPPTFPHFYSEMCNLTQEANSNPKSGNISNTSVVVIYSKYDVHQMAAILGTARVQKMISSSKSLHMFTSSSSVV